MKRVQIDGAEVSGTEGAGIDVEHSGTVTLRDPKVTNTGEQGIRVRVTPDGRKSFFHSLLGVVTKTVLSALLIGLLFYAIGKVTGVQLPI